ncbi:hypothetical protein WJX81_003438 [Elliptochloris bilobata]|uniref:PPIase cyclophilin-type domain-containing protein n=1 Tax=Elliptochloris bilobata TaxID=381761 RepID=A0AAW1QBN8_9CHLO
MTRFCGDAVGVRAGRPKNFATGKERRRDMEVFQRTGRHPDLARGPSSDALPSLPERDLNRQHVFFDLRQGQETLGRLLVEVFEDAAPLAARHFLNRCREGSSEGLQGTCVHRLLPDLGLFFGTSRGHRGGAAVRRYPGLHHLAAGVVSISRGGEEVAITLAKALSLDPTHQVVGRVHGGAELLARLNRMRTGVDDMPFQRITVVASGLTDNQGTHETLAQAAARAARRGETAEQAKQRLEADSAVAREAVKDAIQSGFGQKRKALEALAAAPPAARRGVLDTMMLGGSSDSDSGSDDDGDPS